ncbi:MAG: hypothetical protein ACPGVI_02600 [Crocinitomicaceae bacterium]
MKVLLSFFAFLLLFSLSGCIEIIDDISFNADGSGTFKYNVNLSSSKVKINSVLALDSLDGKKIPSISEIETKINEVVNSFKTKEGISEVSFESNYSDFIFKIKCDFSSLSELQNAIRSIVQAESKNRKMPELDHNWLSFSEGNFTRSVPQITTKKITDIKAEDRELLKQGTYTSITRFDIPIESCTNEKGKLSKSQKAIMVRSNIHSLIQNPNLLDNSINLVKTN